jgi:hypothetical protein
LHGILKVVGESANFIPERWENENLIDGDVNFILGVSSCSRGK